MGNKLVATGVTVIWDDAKHAKVNVKEGPFDKNKIPKGAEDDFTPSRIVVDLKLDLGDAKATTVVLDGVHVQIAYTAVAKQSTPIVGWWNGQKWVRFKDVTFAGNIIDVTLPSPWPTDPAIGVYP
jgi:hypothetical protein